MSQLPILLWKNFIWIKRHWLRALFFYVLPLGFSCFTYLILQESPIVNTGDCDFEDLVLPPSHPALFVSSLVCRDRAKCQYRNENESVTEIGDFFQRKRSLGEEPFNMTIDSMMCPGKKKRSDNQAKGMSYFQSCMTREDDVRYRRISDLDFVYRGQLLYYPSSSRARNVIKLMQKYLDQIELFKLGLAVLRPQSKMQQLMNDLAQVTLCYQRLSDRTYAFDSKQAALDYSKSLNKSLGIVWGMINFNETSEHHMSYELISTFFGRSSPNAQYLQSLTESAMTTFLADKKATEITPAHLTLKQLPKRCRKDPAIYTSMAPVIFASVSLGFISVVSSFAGEMSYEKAAGLLEFLFIAGVSRVQVKLSWLIYCCFLSSSIMILVATVYTTADPLLFEFTDVSLIYMVFFNYSVAIVCLCFVVASVAKEAQQASISMLIIMLIGYFLPTWGNFVPAVGYQGVRLWFLRVICCLHPTVNIMVAMSYVLEYEAQQITLDWSTWYKTPVEEDDFGCLAECLGYFYIQMFGYIALSFYFDHVAPSKYGFQKPFYFFLMPSFWFPGFSLRGKGNEVKQLEENLQDADIEKLGADDDEKKAGASPPRVGISIRNLSKIYGNGFRAVSDLSVNFYANEITAFLGHNGAGKSTTINMITGMISPSLGTAKVGGRDIRSQMPQIRESLGFCPQYDIVYPELSVEEHMYFYGKLKGINQSKVNTYSQAIFKRMNMDNKKQMSRAAMNLSGGMKRKLSIAIAFMGQPTTVILDEPTSAIDPFSRRAIWDLILHFRKRSTIVISTHYMQEADILGDRIAIINGGILKCFGSPMYLKSRYGDGSFLKLAHRVPIAIQEIHAELSQNVTLSLTAKSDTETTFSIPHENAKSVQMIELFENIERQKEKWNIESFGITESTLEQVFFRVAADHVAHDENDEDSLYEHSAGPAEIGYKKHSGPMLYLSHFMTTFIKRFTLSRRSFKGLVFQVIMPLVFAAILVFMNNLLAQTGLDGAQEEHNLKNNNLEPRLMFYAGDRDLPMWKTARDQGFGSGCYADKIASLNLNGSLNPTCLITKEWPDDEFDQSDNKPECSCNFCPIAAPGTAGPRALLPSGDVVLNLNGRNVTDYMIKTSEKYFMGGITVDKLEQYTIQDLEVSDIMNAVVMGVFLDELAELGGLDYLSTLSPEDLMTFLMETAQKLGGANGAGAMGGGGRPQRMRKKREAADDGSHPMMIDELTITETFDYNNGKMVVKKTNATFTTEKPITLPVVGIEVVGNGMATENDYEHPPGVTKTTRRFQNPTRPPTTTASSSYGIGTTVKEDNMSTFSETATMLDTTAVESTTAKMSTTNSAGESTMLKTLMVEITGAPAASSIGTTAQPTSNTPSEAAVTEPTSTMSTYVTDAKLTKTTIVKARDELKTTTTQTKPTDADNQNTPPNEDRAPSQETQMEQLELTLEGLKMWNFGFGGALEMFKQELNISDQVSAYLKMFVREESAETIYTLWTGVKMTEGRRPTFYELNMQFMTPSFLNAFHNVLLRVKTGLYSSLVKMRTSEIGFDDSLSLTDFVNGILLGVFTSFALVMPLFSVLSVVVVEQASGNKQLQVLMGLSRVMYWLANYVWDVLLFMCSVVIMILFMGFFPEVFTINFFHFFILSTMFGMPMIILSYILSYMFDTSRNAILVIAMGTFMVTFWALMINIFRNKDWFESVNNASQVMPPYFLTSSVVLLSFYPMIPADFRPETPFTFEPNGLGPSILRLLGSTVVMLCVLILLESGLLRMARDFIVARAMKDKIDMLIAKASAADEMDSDVKQEVERIKQLKTTGDDQELLTVEDVSKFYLKGKKLAVKGVTFGVRKAECFGLLGVNGAGKSTLFQMLAGFHPNTSGDAKILGHSIFKSPGKVSSHMSYCPQHDVLFPNMTVLEHMTHYARIRGIAASDRDDVVFSLVDDVGLTAHISKPAGSLSGGNKRKLNFAISMLDYPDVIFCDEMTTGMDPKARRSAWGCLQKAIDMGCAVVITSHSMEECEALCNRLVIMVNGTFKCIGGVQYLKDKYGKNYNLKCRLSPNTPWEKLQNRMKDIWVDCVIAEAHVGYLEVSIPASQLLLSNLFRTIHELKTEFQIEEFSVSQTSLEHVFVNMVKDKNWDDSV